MRNWIPELQKSRGPSGRLARDNTEGGIRQINKALHSKAIEVKRTSWKSRGPSRRLARDNTEGGIRKSNEELDSRATEVKRTLWEVGLGSHRGSTRQTKT